LRSCGIRTGPAGTAARTCQGRGGRSAAAAAAKAVARPPWLGTRPLRAGAGDKGRREVFASVS